MEVRRQERNERLIMVEVSREITVINDGNGIALLGDPAAIERYLADEGLPSRDLGMARLTSLLGASSAGTQAAAQAAQTSGRWVQLTEKSAHALKQGTAMKGSTPDASRAILVNPDTKKTQMILEFAKTPGAALTNPALLTGAAGLMAQLAMQQTMDQITDYLETIDAKLDDVLRNQKDALVANLSGVGFAIDEAITVREAVGRVSEVTWSKIQGSQPTIFGTQTYALRKIDDLATKLEGEQRMGKLVDVTGELQAGVQEWLALLARCFQLQDALGILELDRVLDATPEELDLHRVGLRKARQNRIELIADTTEFLLSRVAAAVATANDKVLTNPFESPKVVQASRSVSDSIVEFRDRLAIEKAQGQLESRRWREAAGDARDKIVQTSSRGVQGVRQLGSGATVRARSGVDKVGGRVAEGIERAKKLRGEAPDG